MESDNNNNNNNNMRKNKEKGDLFDVMPAETKSGLDQT